MEKMEKRGNIIKHDLQIGKKEIWYLSLSQMGVENLT